MKLLDWTAAILCAAGVLMLAYHIIWGWPMGIVSNLMYVLVARRAKLHGLLAIEVFLVGCSTLGWYKWSTGG